MSNSSWLCGDQPWGPLDNAQYYSLTPCFLDAVLFCPFYLAAVLLFISKIWLLAVSAPPPAKYNAPRRDDITPLTQPIAGQQQAEYLLVDEDDMDHNLAELCAKRTPEAYAILCDLASIDLVLEAKSPKLWS